MHTESTIIKCKVEKYIAIPHQVSDFILYEVVKYARKSDGFITLCGNELTGLH